MTRADKVPGGTTTVVIWMAGILLGLTVGLLTSDVILGVGAGAIFVAIAVGLQRLWYGGGTRRPRHP